MKRLARASERAALAVACAEANSETLEKDQMDTAGPGNDATSAECVDAFVGSPYQMPMKSELSQGSSGDEIPTSPAMRTSNL